MRSNRLPNKQIERAFDRFVKDPTGGVPTDCGFDSKTEAALFGVYMDPSPITIALARKELAKQLDGTHAREDEASMARILKERGLK